MGFSLPKIGFVFWPVGNGDSTTIVIDLQTCMQVDLHHLECASDTDDARIPVLDRLLPLLPKRDGKPYLALFVLTHPDQDHCRGFKELLKKATIGELWFSPRIFWEYKNDLSEDACTFRDEAVRRVTKTIRNAGAVNSGDRVRVIGYSDVLHEREEYKDLPDEFITVPGNAVTEVDGIQRTDFRAFIHGPFKDDSESERNETSVAMQVTLKNGSADGKAMLLGDLSYPTVRRIIDETKAAEREGDLAWDAFLATHHCSKSLMYWRGPEDDDEVLKQDILDDLEMAGGKIGHIVSSSDLIPSSNEPGDNPPHAKAAARYREIAPTEFLCTGEHPTEKNPEPIVFELGEQRLDYRHPGAQEAKTALSIHAAAATARGSSTPPTEPVGFGKKRD
jgi:beta-lactamase superfamily II metal-dependent hydrolase